MTQVERAVQRSECSQGEMVHEARSKFEIPLLAGCSAVNSSVRASPLLRSKRKRRVWCLG